MGFTQKESEAALIAVKNESIELALDKVFENKNNVEQQQENDLQNIIESSLTSASNQAQAEKEEQSEEDKRKEEEQKKEEERQKKLEENKKLREEKAKEKADIQQELDNLNKLKQDVRNSQTFGFSLFTSFEPSVSPMVAGCVQHKHGSYYLNLKQVSYYEKYLHKVVKKEGTTEISTIDSYNTLNIPDDSSVPSEAMIKHSLTHSKFSINTLLPLFVGYQTKKDWKLELNKGPAQIFKEGETKEIKLDMFKEIYGCVTLRDYFSEECNGLLGVYGKGKENILLPIEINSKYECVQLHEPIKLDVNPDTKYSMKSENGFVLLKANKKVVVYQLDNINFSRTFAKVLKSVDLPSDESEVSLIDTSSYAEKTTEANINQLLSSSDSPAKHKKLENLLRPAHCSDCKMLIANKDQAQLISLTEEKEDERNYQEENSQEESKYDKDIDVKNTALIDRKMIKNIEDFDTYESLFQGESLHKPPFLMDTEKAFGGVSQDDDCATFEVNFDKPISLFCLGIELYFDADMTKLKEILGQNDTKEVEQNAQSTKVEVNESITPVIDDNMVSYEDTKGETALEMDKSENKCLPLIVYTNQGCAFNATSQTSKLVSDDKRSFAANYAGSSFVFSHQFGKRFIIDQYLVMSENSSQIGAFPMGSGILFIGDNLSSLENTTPFHSFTLKDYLEWKDKRMYDPRPLEAYEPVGYFDMGSSVRIVDKISSKRPCKYVKLVPTAFKKTASNSFPQERFPTYPVEFKFFGVMGEELDSKLESIETSEAVITND